jgi:K+-transporting ATPase KdpF subunit
MELDSIVGLLASIAMLLYLVTALLYPERF